MAEEKPAQATAGLKWVRTPDFEEKYANNVVFESSGWDLKVVFGTLDQGTPDQQTYGSTIGCHTSIIIPWRQAKLFAYAACMNVLWHEKTEGKINVISPTPPVDVLVKNVADTPEGKRLIELDAMIRAVLFDEKPEAN